MVLVKVFWSSNDAFFFFFFNVCICQRLQSKVLKLVDISYGGENGFNQAIELSTEVLSNVKFIQEKKLIGISEMQFTYSVKSFLCICVHMIICM